MNSMKLQYKNNQIVLLISFLIIASYMIVEAVGGIFTNSLALLSDAGHMLSDSIALGISLIAFKLSEQAASSHNTYGLKRFEIIARSEEHTSELQSRFDLVCRLLLEKK